MAAYPGHGWESDPEGDLFDVLTQGLFVPEGDLPEVDQYLTQTLTEFDIDAPLANQSEEGAGKLQGGSLQRAEEVQRFGPRVTSSQIVALQQTAVPANTKKNTSWAINVWDDWAAYRMRQDPTDCPPFLFTMQLSELNDWLCRFVVEVRRKDGKHYPPNTLHQLCCGLLRRLRECDPSLDFFKNPEFDAFRKTLDAEMKRLRRISDVPLGPKRAEPFSEMEEEILWEKGLLGSHSPQALVDTMVFKAGLYFALRSGDEHRRPKFSSIRLVEKPGCTPCLVYTEAASKNNPGGLKHRKLQNKQVTHYANSERPERCFVELYKKYCSHRPVDVIGDTFYLSPLSKPKGMVWFKNQPIGIHTLASTVKRLCEKAGIEGYKTNHSLRVTTATRLFQSGVDEQLIMERTGHRSTDGIRAYKRSCPEQAEQLSKVLNLERREVLPTSQEKPKLLPPSVFSTTSTSTTFSLEKENRPPTPSINLSGCSGITINVVSKD